MVDDLISRQEAIEALARVARKMFNRMETASGAVSGR